MAIDELIISYSDFSLGDTIDPDAFDQNNFEIVTKVNEIIESINDGVFTDDIVDAAVTTPKIADGAVTAVKVAADVATQAELEAHTSRVDNPHNITAAQLSAITSIDGISNPGGGVDLVGGTGILIESDNVNKTITLTATSEAIPGAHTHSDEEIEITDANSHFTAGTLDGVLDELFTSVSDGKTEVATAITDKGVEASGSDTFTELASKIDSIVLGSGDAVEANVLSGKTFSNDFGTDKVGTMTNQGTYNIMPSTSNIVIPAGYHSGSGVVYGDGDLISSNIKSGVNIFGVVGNLSSVGFTVQRGRTPFYYNNEDKDVTISPVDVSKSVVICSRESNSHGSDSFIGYLTSSTNLRINRYNSSFTDTYYCNWQVITFNGNISIQSGIHFFTTSSNANISITPVDLSKSFFIYNTHDSSSSTQRQVSAYLYDSSTIVGYCNVLTAACAFNWYVIEFLG